MSDPAQRIAQLPEAERTEEVGAQFAAINFQASVNMLKDPVLMTFARHPQLTGPYINYNQHLLISSTLPVRLRQIAILRTGWLRRGRLMWASHIRLSLTLGLDGADFDAIKIGPGAPHWSAMERAVLEATDQLIEGSDIEDAIWARLVEEFDDKQMMDLIFTVGTYILMAMSHNAMRIQRTPDLIEIAETYGEPT